MPIHMLYRLAGYAGLICGVILVINVARRGGALPVTTLTHAIAPFGALTGLLAFTGLYLWQRAETGLLGLIGYVLNAAGLAGAFAIEYTLHFVFPYLTTAQVDELLAGDTRVAFTVTAFTLIAGVLAFGAASWRAGRFPKVAVAMYVLGMVPGALRNVVPEAVYLGGLAMAAVGTAWLAWTLVANPVRVLVPASI